MKFDPEEIKQFIDEAEGLLRGHRDWLNQEPRVANPFKESLDAAKTKYKDLSPRRRASRFEM